MRTNVGIQSWKIQKNIGIKFRFFEVHPVMFEAVRIYLGILSRKFLLRQHNNGNLIVATMTTIMTMKNPDKITRNGDI